MRRPDRLVEKRKFVRFARTFGVNIIALGRKKTLPKLNHETGVTLSLGGVLIRCERSIAKGSRVTLKIMMARNGQYKTSVASARIVWCKRSFDSRTTYYIGAKFERLSPDNRAGIRWFFK